MRLNFEISFVEKHLLIKDGDNVILVDTGSPITIHTSNKFEFGGRSYNVSTNAMGNTVEKLQQMSGVEFTTLMGLDIISEYKVIFDYPNKQITFCTPDESNPRGELIRLRSMMGTIIVPVMIKDQQRRMILDTGATYSYINSSITNGLIPQETTTDFSPLVGGQFTTPVFEMESALEGKVFACNYGNLPREIEMMVNMIGTDGVIGYDLLRSFKMMINIRESVIILMDE